MQQHHHQCHQRRAWASQAAARRPAGLTHVVRQKSRQPCRATGAGDGAEGGQDAASTRRSTLEAVIRRKQATLEAQLKELGMEALEERLQSSVQVPSAHPYRLARLIAENVPQGKAVLAFELSRSLLGRGGTGATLADQAKHFVSLGADALVVPMDQEETPGGLADLFSVCQAVPARVPVLAKDWMIHPLQVVEVKQAGAAGVLGVIHQVNGRGTAVMSSFSAAVGLDAPVEVVNVREVEGLAKAGVVFYGINLSVGLSLPIPGFSSDVAHGILGTLPFGCISMVGARTMEEARKARASGADSLFIKKELLQSYLQEQEAAGSKDDPFRKTGLRLLVDELRYLTSNDD